MEMLVDNFSSILDKIIKDINGLRKKGNAFETLEERFDDLLFGMATIEKAKNDLLNYKQQNPQFKIQPVVDYDFKLSEYAEKFYVQSKEVIEFSASKQDNVAVRLISRVKKDMLWQYAQLMMQISARWHIERMIDVFEFDTEFENRAFPKRKPLLQECIFFADRMNATKLGITFKDGIMPRTIIFAVQPNAGKSFIANVYSLMSSCLHRIYYNTSGILRMSNNTANAIGFSNQIKAMIENEKIALIYPEFEKYFPKGGKPQILEKATAEEWKIAGLDPRIRASYFARGRDTAINSIRVFVALIIDDLSDGFDQMNNDEAHQDMTTKFYIDMESRKESEFIPSFICGTMFNEFDIQNTMISKAENEVGLIQHPKFRNVRHTPDYSTVVVAVDCFDDKNESYAPNLISTKKLIDKQNSLKPFEFDLVYRQIRSSREPRIFDYDNLKLYKEVPETLKETRIAVLDPTRKNGADFFALPVFAFNEADGDPYFIDCIYEQKSLGKTSDPRNMFLDRVVKFLIENNVTEFYIENNTSNTLGLIFEEKFRQFNHNCRVFEFYTAKEKGFKNKLERILHEEPTITANIHFPAPNMYPPLHRVSQFMNDFTRFDSKLEGSNKKQHDDAPDSMAIFSKRCLYNRKNRFATITGAFSLKNLWKN